MVFGHGYTYTYGKEREREERERERERDDLYMYITCWPRSLLTTLDFSESDRILPSIIFSTTVGTYCVVTIMTSTVDIHSYTSSISLIQSLILSNDP